MSQEMACQAQPQRDCKIQARVTMPRQNEQIPSIATQTPMPVEQRSARTKSPPVPAVCVRLQKENAACAGGQPLTSRRASAACSGSVQNARRTVKSLNSSPEPERDLFTVRDSQPCTWPLANAPTCGNHELRPSDPCGSAISKRDESG